MIALSDVAVGLILVIGILIIGLISILPFRGLARFEIRGRFAFQMVGSLLLLGVVFFLWMQSQQKDIKRLAEGAIRQAERAEEQAGENLNRIQDIERVRDDAFYTACVDRNDTRIRVRSEYRAMVSQEWANLVRLQSTPILDITELPGYAQVQDPGVTDVFDAVSLALTGSRQEALRVQMVEVETAQNTLDNYIAAEPFEQCGDDPIPDESAVRPPVLVEGPPEINPTSTSSTSTTTTTPRPTTLPQPPTTSPTAPAPTPRPTTAPTPAPTTTESRPGNAGGNGNGNAGGNGNGNGNGNGRGNR